MTGRTRVADTATATFCFPEAFSGFEGHFPARKILPGVCQIFCVLLAIAGADTRPPRLREVLLAKYAAPVFPGDEVVCVVEKLAETDGEGLFRARLSKGGQRVTELKLRVVL